MKPSSGRVPGTHPRRVVLVAVASDASLTVAKFLAALFSGSTAMFAEALHSLGDSLNQGLLLVGHKLAARPADRSHPFGYGKERFFWPFVVSVVTFSIGGVFSVQKGIEQVLRPKPLDHFALNAVVLAAAFLLDGISWTVARRELKRSAPGKPLWTIVRESKMPGVVAVFLEDLAAVAGVGMAAVGLTAAYFRGLWWADGVASLLIGVLLLGVAVLIAARARSLLIGEGASPETEEKIRRIVDTAPQTERLLTLLTMHLGPEEILVNLDIEFKDGLTTEDIESAVDYLESEIRAAVPETSKIFIEAESLAKAVSSKPL